MTGRRKRREEEIRESRVVVWWHCVFECCFTILDFSWVSIRGITKWKSKARNEGLVVTVIWCYFLDVSLFLHTFFLSHLNLFLGNHWIKGKFAVKDNKMWQYWGWLWELINFSGWSVTNGILAVLFTLTRINYICHERQLTVTGITPRLYIWMLSLISLKFSDSEFLKNLVSFGFELYYYYFIIFFDWHGLYYNSSWESQLAMGMDCTCPLPCQTSSDDITDLSSCQRLTILNWCYKGP